MNTFKKIWLFITTTITLGIITVYAAQIITTTSQTAVSWDKISADWVNAVNNFVTNPTWPTPNADDDSSKMATTEWVQDKVVSANSDIWCITITSQAECRNTISTYWIPKSAYYSNNIFGSTYDNFYRIICETTYFRYYVTSTSTGDASYSLSPKLCY